MCKVYISRILSQQKSASCTSIKNEEVRPPFELRRRRTTTPTIESTSSSVTPNDDIASTTPQYLSEEKEEQTAMNEQLTEEKIYTTLLRILQGMALITYINIGNPIYK